MPGGGVEPPRGCPRRILSPLFAILHEVAIDRKPTHKASICSAITANVSVQCVAVKCTKVGNEQPSKQPQAVPADFYLEFAWTCLIDWQFAASQWLFDGCFYLQTIAVAMFLAAQNLDAIRSSQRTKPASSTWWLFSPMRGSFCIPLRRFRAPTTPKAYPWGTPFASGEIDEFASSP